MNVYLAHSHRHREDGKRLEQQIRKWGHRVYNPFDTDPHGRYLTEAWAKAEKSGDQKRLLQLCPAIYHKDMSHIADSDVVVVYYPDESTGTAMEIVEGRDLRRIIIVLTDMIHPFIHSNADHVIPLNSDKTETLKSILRDYQDGVKR